MRTVVYKYKPIQSNRMHLFDKTLYISLIVSLGITMIFYIYARTYDHEKKEDAFFLKIFILSFSLAYISTYIMCNRNNNPIDNIYTSDPDF